MDILTKTRSIRSILSHPYSIIKSSLDDLIMLDVIQQRLNVLTIESRVTWVRELKSMLPSITEG
jgi:hypothetical protein